MIDVCPTARKDGQAMRTFLKSFPWFGFWLCCIFSFSCFGQGTSVGLGAEYAHSQKDLILERVKNLPQSCIRNSIKKTIIENPNHPDRSIFLDWNSELSKYTEVAIAEFLIEHFEKFQAMDDEVFCEEVLLPQYIKGYKEVYARKKKKQGAVLAPLGSDAIDADDVVIQLSHNHYFKHYLGHSDISRAALNVLNSTNPEYRMLIDKFQNLCACAISQDSIDAVAKASQLPDIYKWDDETFHAHSPSYPDGIQTGIQKYIKLFEEQINSFRKDAKSDTFKAVFRLGAMLHMIQDLIYHHGITLAQHSGLAYKTSNAFTNPDFPEGSEAGGFSPKSEAEKRFDAAKFFSIKLIIMAIQNLGQNTIRDIFTIPSVLPGSHDEKERKKNFHISINYVFCNQERGQGSSCEQQISTWKLINYYLLHWSFQEPYTELVQVHNSLVPWNPEKVLSKLELQLNGH